MSGGTGEHAEAAVHHARFLEAALSGIPDYVYAFDRQRRFAYANPAMLALFGLTADEMIGKTLGDLDYPEDLATLLNGHIDRIVANGETIQDEVFFRSPTGHAAYFAYFWGPVRDQDGSVALVVGVSRDTSERRGIEEALRRSEARLRAATELVGIGIYAWDPVSGALEWDDRLRAMWDLPPDVSVDLATFEGGVHPDDRARVRAAIAACANPAGDGLYEVEYRVVGQCDGQMRHILSSGRTTFTDGRATDFIGAALDVTEQRATAAAIRISEAQFRSFAAHSSNLIWLGDPVAGMITYRSAAFERIWGVPLEEGKDKLTDWMLDVHPDDRGQVEHALAAVARGEVIQFEYRLIRPGDGALRWLRDTSFPILDDAGGVRQIGGITEDLTQGDVRHVYIVSRRPAEARRLGGIVRSLGLHPRTFDSAAAFLDIAAVLTPGCVLVDLRHARLESLSVPRELKARSIALPTIALDSPDADRDAVLAAMKAGVGDYLIMDDEASFRSGLETAIEEARGTIRPSGADETAAARLTRLTPREREVLGCLVDGNTNKKIGQRLGISPRTVELHRAQVMSRLNASTLAELVQIAVPPGSPPRTHARRRSGLLPRVLPGYDTRLAWPDRRRHHPIARSDMSSPDAEAAGETRAAVTIGWPAADLRELWLRPATQSAIWSHFAVVTAEEGGAADWSASGPAFGTYRWRTELTGVGPDRLAWSSREGADLPNTGVLIFRPAPGDRGTELHLDVHFDPPGGAIGAALGKLFNVAPREIVLTALYKFRALAVTGEIPTTDPQPAARKGGADR